MTVIYETAASEDDGLVLTFLETPAGRLDFAALPLFRVELFSTLDDEMVSAEASAAPEWTISVSDAGDVRTVAATWDADPDVALAFTITKETDGIAFRLTSVVSSDDYRVRGVALARFRVLPWGTSADFRALTTMTTGHVIARPHVAGSSACGPDQDGYASFWSVGDPRQLYAWHDDDAFHAKLFGFQSFGGTSAYFEHLMIADRRFAGPDLARDYAVRVEIFASAPKRPEYAAYEAAERYAVWARDPARPWRQIAPWIDAGDVPDSVKRLDCQVTFKGGRSNPAVVDGPDVDSTPRWKADIVDGWKGVCGFEYVACEVSDWGNPAGFQEPYSPMKTFDGALPSAVTDLFDDLSAEDVQVLPYVLPRNIDARNPSGWAFDDWDSAVGLPTDLSPYLQQTRDGELRQEEFNYGLEDATAYALNFAVMPPAYFEDLAVRLADELPTGTLGGLYLDAMGSVIPPAYLDPLGTGNGEFHDGPDDAEWTYSAFVAGKRAAMEAALAALRELNPQASLRTEWPAAWALGPIRVTAHNDGVISTGWAGLFHVVHGDLTRFYSFQAPSITNNISQVGLLSLTTTQYWLRSGVFSYGDGFDLDLANGQAVFADPPETSNLYYWFTWAARLKSMEPVCRPYFGGRMRRPMLADFREGLFAGSLNGTVWQEVVGQLESGLAQWFAHECWQKADGSLGLIATFSWNPSFGFALPDVVRTLELDTAADGLPAGWKEVYRTTNNGARTLLARFQTTVSVPLTFVNDTVTLIEVVAAADDSTETEGAAWRTSRVGASMTFNVTGTGALDVRFGTSFLQNAGSGVTLSPGVAAVRAYPVGSEMGPPPFRHVPAVGTVKLLYAADPTVAYRAEIVAVRLGEPHLADRTPVRGPGRWTNPQAVSDPLRPSFGAFVEVDGIGVTAGASIVRDERLLPRLDAVVFGDGAVERVLRRRGYDAAGGAASDDGGAIGTYVRLLLDTVCASAIAPARSPRPVLWSHAEATLRAPTFPARLADGSFFGTSRYWEAGAGVDIADGAARPRQPFREWPGWAAYWADRVVDDRPYADFFPEVVVIALGAADADWYDGTANWSVSVKDGLLGLIAAARSAYATNPVICVFKPHLAGPTGFSPWTGAECDLVADAIDRAVAEAEDSPYDVPADRLGVIDLRAIADASPGYAPWGRLLTAEQHRVLADGAREDFVGLILTALSGSGPSLALDDEENSMNIALL